jgi:ABC-type phosphate transport system substrate-binding protein
MKNNWLKILIIIMTFVGTCTPQILAQTGVDVIVNEGVQVNSLEMSALKDILLGKTAYWPGGQAVVIMVLAEKTDPSIQETTGMSASQFKTHWQRLTFSGRGKQPKEADTADKIVALVSSTKGGVALVPAGTALQGVKKIEIKK